MNGPARRIFANLDCELDFAASSGRCGPSRPPPSRAALGFASTLGTLLRAFANAGDRLWTPAEVARERLADLPGLPRPELESGPLALLPRPRAVLAWAETRRAADHRASAEALPALDPGDPAPLHELLWRLPPPDPAAVAAVHHRAFALHTARRLGCDLPGSRLLASPGELDDHLRELAEDSGTARPAAVDAWVVKAPFSAAGRERHVVRGEPAAGDRRRVRRLFERHGSLLFEPWLDRVDDRGLVAVTGPAGTRLVGGHRSFVGSHGAFEGLELDAEFAGLQASDRNSRRLLEDTVQEVGRALAARGYVGPFGVDAWRFRRPGGELAWNPLGEINARMTLGLAARALVDRIREPLGIPPRARVRLGWGHADPPAGAVVLVHAGPTRRSGPAVWLHEEIPLAERFS